MLRRILIGEFALVCVLFLLLWMPQCALPDNSASKRSAQHDPGTEERSEEKSEPRDQQPTSYAYLGAVESPVPQTSESNRAVPARQRSETDEKGEGDSQNVSQGSIPELTIEVTASRLRVAAERLGYVLVAQTSQGILGKIEEGTLIPMRQAERKQYATRGRSASKHPDAGALRRGIAAQLPEADPDDVRLTYLVPTEVEARFVEAQLSAIEEAGLTPDEVAVVYARYSEDAIKVTRLRLTDGSVRDAS